MSGRSAHDHSLRHDTAGERNRWLSLYVLCLGFLIIIIDATIVNVALPQIRAELRFSAASLVWVVNAYLLAFGGCLLLGGRLGDLLGRRRAFLLGIALFTAASLGCGLATSQQLLIAARAAQGVGAAVVSAVALAITLILFEDSHSRAKAVGVLGFVGGGGGSIALLVGGALTTALNWHWIFFVNLPVGVLVCLLGLKLLPEDRHPRVTGYPDIAGAVTVTAAVTLVLYTIVGDYESSRISARQLELLAAAVALLLVFVRIESRVSAPLVPLSLFRQRSLVVANLSGVLLTAAIYAWYFITTLYLQLVLEFTPLQVGLTFLPANLIAAIFSLGLSARLIARFGLKLPLIVGQLLTAAGLALFARAPLEASLATDLLPGMLLLGLGVGMASTPLLLAAMDDVVQSEFGLASGVVNTANVVGGALGLAILVRVAAVHAADLTASGVSSPLALTSGYHIAFAIGASFSVAAAVIAATLPRPAYASFNRCARRA